MVVAGAHPHIRKAQGVIEGDGGIVVRAHLEGDGLCSQRESICRHALEQALGDALPALRRVHAHIEDAQLAVDHLTACAAHKGAVFAGDPPAAVRAPDLVGELAARPGVGGHGAALQLDGSVDVVDRERVQEEAAHCAAVCNPARGQGVRDLEAGALCLLGIREARVDGEQHGRVAAAELAGPLHGGKGLQQAEAVRGPQLLGAKGEGALLEAGGVLAQAVADERQLLPRLAPGLGNLGGLAHGVEVKAGHAPFIEHEAHGVDLLAHGVFDDSHAPAQASPPCMPGNGVERGHPEGRTAQAAGDALGGGDADAHAGERAGAPAGDDQVDVCRRKPRARQQLARPRQEDLVRAARCRGVCSGDELRLPARDVAQAEGEHVACGVEGQCDSLASHRASGSPRVR